MEVERLIMNETHAAYEIGFWIGHNIWWWLPLLIVAVVAWFKWDRA